MASEAEPKTTPLIGKTPSATDPDNGQIHPITHNAVLDDGVLRALKSRHLQMIALGGVIGPGTFYAFGYALQYAGPVGALIGYIIIGVDVFLVTQSLGEMEFWLASFKFVAVLALYLVAILLDTGVIGGDYIGFRYWSDPGPFANGINGLGKVLVLAAVMYSGTEAVAITGGEARDPRKAIPGLIVASDSEGLLNASSKSAASPFTVALVNAGWSRAGNLINAVIVVTLLSSINSAIYIGSRTIFAQARAGRAPAFLGCATKNGIPLHAIVFTNLFGMLSLLNLSESAGAVFTYLLDISGAAAYIAWAFIGLTHLRFRKAMRAQGMAQSELPFRSWGYPYVPWALLCVNLFLVVISGYATLLTPFDLKGFIFSYLVIPVFALLYLGWKVWYKTKVVNPSEADLVSGRRDWLGSAVNDEETLPSANILKKAKTCLIG